MQACVCFVMNWVWESEGVNVIFGYFEGCLRVVRQVDLSRDLLY